MNIWEEESQCGYNRVREGSMWHIGEVLQAFIRPLAFTLRERGIHETVLSRESPRSELCFKITTLYSLTKGFGGKIAGQKQRGWSISNEK